MNDIKFNISEHWLPINEKWGTIDKDTLRIKVSGINFHTQQEASSWGLFTGYIKPDTNNTYDPNAIGFYKSDGTLLGYVQKELQDYVGKFTKGRELDCVIAITPFFSKEGKIRNQAYATILKFFEDDIEYATETRALEVLDEIQNAILGLSVDALFSKPANSIVYEMPEA